jgi:hypothetical protein
MPPRRRLPERPDLDQLRHQARGLQRAAAGGDRAAADRLGVASPRPSLAAAQLAVAREYGFSSWPRLAAGDFADMRAFADNRLAPLPGTDVWHATLCLPAATRVPYRLSPDDALTPLEPGDPEAWRGRTAGFRLDPLNRHPWPPDAPWWSTFAAPGAPPARGLPVWPVRCGLRRTVRRGQSTTPGGGSSRAGSRRRRG